MNIIKKCLDYKRRKALDKQARDLWVDTFSTVNYRGLDSDKVITISHEAVKAFYAAFYPNHTS